MKSHEQKITEAAQRNRVYKALSPFERLALCKARRGKSKKETLRLRDQINADNSCKRKAFLRYEK